MTPRFRTHSWGFSLPELLVVIVILGVLGAVGVASLSEWRRERVNTAALELAGWLDAIRRTTARGQGCTVTLATNNASLPGNSVLATAAIATVPPAPGDTNIPTQASTLAAPHCQAIASPQLPFTTPGTTFDFQSSTTTFTFTPRGTVNPVPAANAPIEITITLNQGGPSRCVQLSGMLGLVEIGRRVDGVCIYGQRF